MKIQTVAGTRTLSGEPPRSTAYYYADLERLKRKNGAEPPQETPPNPDELSEYVETNEVVNDGAVREVPPLRDRGRQWSLPEYNTPENSRKIEETYSTAGTFPMPEPKEKEPLLAELEVVGRLPLTQLEGAGGVRRSRSWYLCCPNVADEEMSRESSWRYSSLRPVTAPPVPGHNGLSVLVSSAQSGREDVVSLRAERDALARALSAERARSAAAARAHDARLAELHGVIAELVRRRAHDKHARAIPEEEVSDECESTTQPAGELDNDADHSRTEQNDTSSAISPELPTPQESKVEATLPSAVEELPTDTETSVQDVRAETPRVEVRPPSAEPCDTSLNLSDRDSHVCLSTARCCEPVGSDTVGADGSGAGGSGAGGSGAGGSCERERGSPDEPRLYTPCAGRCESRQAKLASRVKLRRTDNSDSSEPRNTDWWSAERVSVELCAHADLRDALHAAQNEGCTWAARCARCARAPPGMCTRPLRILRTDCTGACAVQDRTSVSLCCALPAASDAPRDYERASRARRDNTRQHDQTVLRVRGAGVDCRVAVLRRLRAADRALEEPTTCVPRSPRHSTKRRPGMLQTVHARARCRSRRRCRCAAALRAADRALGPTTCCSPLAETQHEQARARYACPDCTARARCRSERRCPLCCALAAPRPARIETYDGAARARRDTNARQARRRVRCRLLRVRGTECLTCGVAGGCRVGAAEPRGSRRYDVSGPLFSRDTATTSHDQLLQNVLARAACGVDVGVAVSARCASADARLRPLRLLLRASPDTARQARRQVCVQTVTARARAWSRRSVSAVLRVRAPTGGRASRPTTCAALGDDTVTDKHDQRAAAEQVAAAADCPAGWRPEQGRRCALGALLSARALAGTRCRPPWLGSAPVRHSSARGSRPTSWGCGRTRRG
uniref:Uncharacterized protein n=1 Tax=Heliothis virescens TaxID=7102 RepID=A0A2A4IZ59_HELVI